MSRPRRNVPFFFISAFTVVFSVGGCGWTSSRPVSPSTPSPAPVSVSADRNAYVGAADPLGESLHTIIYLDQGWSPADSQRFYFTSQGSQLLPYDWFLVLEQSDGTTPFREYQNMLGFRYLVQKPDDLNPDGLPVGFVKDKGSDRDWLGLTCAACHTAQIDYKSVGYRIDGGPAMADVRGFLHALADALKLTRDRDEKFSRFASKILGSGDSQEARSTLREQLTEIIDRREGYNVRNFPKSATPGFARVDAFGAILNEVYHRAAKPGAGFNQTSNTRPADAPVSYPFLWDTPQHDRVQWNGAAKNAGLGSLGRNVGEVLGVFGKFEIPDRPTAKGYRSTVQVQNLRHIEGWLRTLRSPTWPSDFPPIDTGKRDLGKQVYIKARCINCHAILDRADANRTVTAVMLPVGTESRMADNFAKRTGASGKLEGANQSVIPWPPLNPAKIGASIGGDAILGHAVIGTLIGSLFPAPEDELTKIEYRRPVVVSAEAVEQGGVYKARPLNGIWATAPYLHNGSVPSLYQLLLPVDKRLKSFSIGTRQFDPVNVGFRTDVQGFPTFRARGDDGKPIPGNSNAGHEFGKELTDEERLQLVEYLKSL